MPSSLSESKDKTRHVQIPAIRSHNKITLASKEKKNHTSTFSVVDTQNIREIQQSPGWEGDFFLSLEILLFAMKVKLPLEASAGKSSEL